MQKQIHRMKGVIFMLDNGLDPNIILLMITILFVGIGVLLMLKWDTIPGKLIGIVLSAIGIFLTVEDGFLPESLYQPAAIAETQQTAPAPLPGTSEALSEPAPESSPAPESDPDPNATAESGGVSLIITSTAHADESGEPDTEAQGSWFQTADEQWKWQMDDGSFYTGWIKTGGFWYYFDDDGLMLSDGIFPVGEKEFYFHPDGRMKTEWQLIGSQWYYFDADEGMLKDTWVDDCYLSSDGHMYMDTTQTIDGVSYTFDHSGKVID